MLMQRKRKLLNSLCAVILEMKRAKWFKIPTVSSMRSKQENTLSERREEVTLYVEDTCFSGGTVWPVPSWIRVTAASGNTVEMKCTTTGMNRLKRSVWHPRSKFSL
jgi:hypothetical protein